MAAFARGEVEQATARLESALAEWPAERTAQNYFLLGEARRHEGSPRLALGHYRSALALSAASEAGGGGEGRRYETTGAIHYSRGLCFMALGEWYAAAEQFESVPPPLPAQALVAAGTCARQLGEHSRALQFFDSALEVDRSNSHARVCRAELCELMGQHERATADYQALLTADPCFTAPHLREAYIAVHDGRLDAAARLCDGLLGLLTNVSASARDAGYFAEQRRQLTELKALCQG
jgi:tetratricopeptide (TPR) repeat protein